MAEAGIDLIVGLGNPGAEYADTRHNAGFWFLDAVAAQFSASLKREAKFHGYAGDISVGGRRVRLLAPDTYMNHSGEAVSRFAAFYKIPVARILVAHDELDLAPGTVRLKQGGGTGGHNGLTDIVSRLGDPGFMRLRLGIGRPGSSRQVVSYVLKRPSAAEQEQIDLAIRGALNFLPDIVAGDYARAMNELHQTK